MRVRYLKVRCIRTLTGRFGRQQQRVLTRMSLLSAAYLQIDVNSAPAEGGGRGGGGLCVLAAAPSDDV